jgi:hypothetical protein
VTAGLQARDITHAGYNGNLVAVAVAVAVAVVDGDGESMTRTSIRVAGER